MVLSGTARKLKVAKAFLSPPELLPSPPTPNSPSQSSGSSGLDPMGKLPAELPPPFLLQSSGSGSSSQSQEQGQGQPSSIGPLEDEADLELLDEEELLDGEELLDEELEPLPELDCDDDDEPLLSELDCDKELLLSTEELAELLSELDGISLKSLSMSSAWEWNEE